jgi:hypothetical protein
VGYRWLEDRRASGATVHGGFCVVTGAGTTAALRPRFTQLAHQLGATDFDAAASKDSSPRDLTHSVASWPYQPTDPTVDSIQFRSRHGDDLPPWAISERPSTDADVAPLLADVVSVALTPEIPELVDAFAILGLVWSDEPDRSFFDLGATCGWPSRYVSSSRGPRDAADFENHFPRQDSTQIISIS